MFNFKNIVSIGLVCMLGACKVSQETLNNRPLLAIPKNFMVVEDSLETNLPNYQMFFKDANLIELIETALTNNFDLQITLQKIEIAKAGIRFTKGLGKPDLVGGFGAGQRKFGRYTIDGVGNFDTQFSTNLNDIKN